MNKVSQFTIQGLTPYSYSHGMEQLNVTRQSTYDLTIDLFLEGKLTAEGMITHRFALEHWREAIRTAKRKRSGSIKVVLDYRI